MESKEKKYANVDFIAAETTNIIFVIIVKKEIIMNIFKMQILTMEIILMIYKKMKKHKKCRVCKSEFTPMYQSTQVVCSVKCAVEHSYKQKDKEWAKKKKILKDELTTVQDLMKLAQQVFNKYIRLRDQGKPCISCKQKPKKENAGHFYSAGTHTAVRFDERNVHLQCEHCNSFLSGNLLMYRENLLAKLGYEEFERLTQDAMKTRKYTREELKEIIKKYKNIIKNLNVKKC